MTSVFRPTPLPPFPVERDALLPRIEHRDATTGRRGRHLVLQHVSMLGQLAILDPERIDHILRVRPVWLGRACGWVLPPAARHNARGGTAGQACAAPASTIGSSSCVGCGCGARCALATRCRRPCTSIRALTARPRRQIERLRTTPFGRRARGTEAQHCAAWPWRGQASARGVSLAACRSRRQDAGSDAGLRCASSSSPRPVRVRARPFLQALRFLDERLGRSPRVAPRCQHVRLG